MRNVSFASFRVHICLDSSVAFRLLAFRKNVLWFRYRSLKFDASPSYDSVVVTVVAVAKMVDHVRLETFSTIKWAFCFLPAVTARVMILVLGYCYI